MINVLRLRMSHNLQYLVAITDVTGKQFRSGWGFLRSYEVSCKYSVSALVQKLDEVLANKTSTPCD